MFHLPAAGVALILGIDHFLDMGRSATNVLGNCIATAVVAKWEGALGKSPNSLARSALTLGHILAGLGNSFWP
jgi:Na+/H+-dicarboxylate symporter